jgi:hypothetical protein
MYFPRNWEFGSALSKLQNFGGGGLNPPKPPRYATDADHSLLPNTEVNNEWRYTSTPTIRLHSVDRVNSTFSYMYHDFSPSAHAVPTIGRLTRQIGSNYEACSSLHSGTVHRRLISQLSVIIWTRNTRMRNVKNAIMGTGNPHVH